MLPSIRTLETKNSNFEVPFSVLGKRSISKFWRFESLQNSRRRRRSDQVNRLFMANILIIYAVYCAVKLVLLRKGRVMCDINFQRNCFIFKVKILKEVRFSESLLILLEIRFVWNNGGQKHSLSTVFTRV